MVNWNLKCTVDVKFTYDSEQENSHQLLFDLAAKIEKEGSEEFLKEVICSNVTSCEVIIYEAKDPHAEEDI